MRLPFVLLLAACSSKTPPAPAPAPGSARPPVIASAEHVKTHVATHADLPRAIQKLVPAHGLYAAGGGLTSSPWRIIVDIDAKTISSGTAAKHNAPSFGPMDAEASHPLADDDKQRLMQLASASRSEPQIGLPHAPTADYDEILVVADGDDVFFENGFGPIRRPNATKLIAELRKLAGL